MTKITPPINAPAVTKTAGAKTENYELNQGVVVVDIEISKAPIATPAAMIIAPLKTTKRLNKKMSKKRDKTAVLSILIISQKFIAII